MGDTLTGSILTPSQREYLREGDHEDISEASARMTRKRIRDRLAAAPIDLAIILQNLPDEELDAAFTEPVHIGAGFHEEPKQSIPDALGVLYLGSIATPESQGVRGLDSISTDELYRQSPLIHSQPFENRTARGIERALTRRGVNVKNVSVSVDIEVEGELALEDERDLSEVPASILEQLKLAGEISEEEYVRELGRRLDIDIGSE